MIVTSPETANNRFVYHRTMGFMKSHGNGLTFFWRHYEILIPDKDIFLFMCQLRVSIGIQLTIIQSHRVVTLTNDELVDWRIYALHWRHNEHDGVSNHQPHGCLLNRLFGRRSKKISKLRVTGLCVGNSVTRKMFPFDDVSMYYTDTMS